MNAEQHIVYAVAGARQRKVRVTGLMDWDDAVNRWYQLDDSRRARWPHDEQARVVLPKFGRVHYFAVRAADDPAWPSTGKRRTPKVLI